MDPSARFPVSRNQCGGILKVCVEVQQPLRLIVGFFSLLLFVTHLYYFVCVCVCVDINNGLQKL